MLINLLFLLIISSGSALAAVLWKKEYEDVLPITISGIILIQFFMGMFGSLEVGFVITICFAGFIWVAAIFILIKKGEIINSIKPFFSHGFWLFVILYVGFNYALYDMKMHEWDEFSHWGTVVKAMIQTGCFGTAHQAHMPFGSYPPGMALFQYLLQRIYLAIRGNGFSEWRLYLAYTVLGISFILPLIKRMGGESFKGKVVIALVIFLAPLSFYSNCYHTLYIDPMLGILSGAGLAMIVATRNKQNTCCFLYFLSVCTMLTLMKMSGILLAVFIAVAYITDYKLQSAATRKAMLKCVGAFALVIGIPKLLWAIQVKASGMQSAASITFCLKDLYNILSGKDDTYRKTVFNSFKIALFNNTITEGNTNFSIGDLGITISYFALLTVFVIMIYLAWLVTKKSNPMRACSILIASLASVVSWLLFYISLGVTYLFKFSEEEALRLNSYSRYTHTVYLGMYLLVITAVLCAVFELYSGKTVLIVVLGISLLLTPMEDAAKLLFRDSVQESFGHREPYLLLSKKISESAKPYDNVFFVCQDERGWSSGAIYWRTSFEVRPIVIDHLDDGWVMASESTDWYISEKNAAEWQQLLVDKYDYVALYRLDDYFFSAFSSLFENPEDINEYSVYKVNKDSGLLELCQ